MDGMLRQSFLPSYSLQKGRVDEINHIGDILKNIQEEQMNLESFPGSCLVDVDAGPSNGRLDKPKVMPSLFPRSIKSIMNPYIVETGRGPIFMQRYPYLPNYHTNYGILGLSFTPFNSSYPFCMENRSSLELQPQSQLFYMQNENYGSDVKNIFPEPTKVKHKLNPEAKEYIPIALLSKMKENLSSDVDCTVKHPHIETHCESTASDFGFIRENCFEEFKNSSSSNNIPPSKQKATDLYENANNLSNSGASRDNVRNENAVQLNLISKNLMMENRMFGLSESEKCQSRVESVGMTEDEVDTKNILEENLLPESQESQDVNTFDFISDIDCKTPQQISNSSILEKDSSVVYLLSDNDTSSDESDDEAESDSDSPDDLEASTSEESDFLDEGLKSDESFIKFGSLDSEDSTDGVDYKKTNGCNCSGSGSGIEKGSIFSLLCNCDSDSESCNDEDSDYDIFSVQLDDGWDLLCGGLQISAFISHCSPEIHTTVSSDSKDVNVVDGLSNVYSDEAFCNIANQEFVPNIVSINEKWENEIAKNLSPKTVTKIKFKNDVEIYPSVDWDRHGPWEQYARDRMRFTRRIEETEPTLSKVLTPEHRQNIYHNLTKV